MTDNQTEGLTTDLIETDDVVTTQPDTDQQEPEDVQETTIPEFIDTGEGDDTEDESPSNVADVERLIEEGDKEAALKRLAEINKGIEKLKSKPEQIRSEVFTELNTFYDAVAEGNPKAIEDLDNEVFGKRGTSLKAVFAASIGLEADELDILLDGGEVKPKAAPKQDKTIEALKADVEAIKKDKADREWIGKFGSSIQKYLRDATELDIPVDVIASARHLLPRTASVSDIEEAVMQVNPRAYREALAKRGSAKTTPAAATISRGGKGSSTPSPDELLSDPDKFMAYLQSQK